MKLDCVQRREWQEEWEEELSDERESGPSTPQHRDDTGIRHKRVRHGSRYHIQSR